MGWDSMQQLIRIILQIAAGWLAGQGWITEDMETTLVGSAVSLAGILWWVLWDRNRSNAANTPKPPSGPTPVA